MRLFTNTYVSKRLPVRLTQPLKTTLNHPKLPPAYVQNTLVLYACLLIFNIFNHSLSLAYPLLQRLVLTHLSSYVHPPKCYRTEAREGVRVGFHSSFSLLHISSANWFIRTHSSRVETNQTKTTLLSVFSLCFCSIEVPTLSQHCPNIVTTFITYTRPMPVLTATSFSVYPN